MSRIGRKLIDVPSNVETTVKDNLLEVKGPKGVLNFNISRGISILFSKGQIEVKRNNDEKKQKSLHGLTRALIANMIKGVSEGYEKKLEIKGVGYRVVQDGKRLNLTLGYSHPVFFTAPEGIDFKVEKNLIFVNGIDNQLVGEVAAKIRSLRRPDPYKGKGIRYFGEQVRTKPGKTAKATAA